MMPSNLRFNNIAVLVSALLLSTAVASDDSWTSRDKFLHFGASFMLDSGGYLVARGTTDWSQPRLLAVSAAAALTVGFVKELADERFDMRDMAWNAAGVAASSGLWYLADRSRRRSISVVILPDGLLGVYAWRY